MRHGRGNIATLVGLPCMAVKCQGVCKPQSSYAKPTAVVKQINRAVPHVSLLESTLEMLVRIVPKGLVPYGDTSRVQQA